MKFGAMIATRIADWRLLVDAEEMGFDHGWVPDSQMIWSDCYAVLALAAANTKRIKLGTGVAIAGTRIAPVTAHSIATINQIAPGRVFLGIGTGHTAMRVMGMDAVKPKVFAEYLRVVRALLHGEEVEYTQDGVTRPIRFLHQDMGFFNVEQPVPIYVAANGPLALAAAGAYGDGRISAGGEPHAVFANNLAKVRAGAEKAGREFADDFHTAALTFSCVLKPGEKLDLRSRDRSGGLHGDGEPALLVGAVPRERIGRVHPPGSTRRMGPLPARTSIAFRRRSVTCACTTATARTSCPRNAQFITPELIRASGGLVGEPDEIIAMLREQERGGLKEVTLLPPMASARECYSDFAKHVIERY